MVMGAGALHVLVALFEPHELQGVTGAGPVWGDPDNGLEVAVRPSPRKVLCSSDTDPGVAPGWSCPGLSAPPAKEISRT